MNDAFCLQKRLKINSTVVESRICGRNQTFRRKGVGELYFYVRSQKQGSFRSSDMIVHFEMDYLEPDEWMEIIRRSKTTNISPLPLQPVFFVDIVETNRKKYQLKTDPYYLVDLLGHFDILFYFHFDDPFRTGQEVSFDIDICTHHRCPNRCELLMWQKQVQLTTLDPSYLALITLQYTPNVRISNLVRTPNGTLKVYWTKAHYKLLESSKDGITWQLCHLLNHPHYLLNISAKDCFKGQEFTRHNYIYYYLRKKTSWNEAYDYCKSKGGNLPIVRSREEYHGLLTLLKLPKATLMRVELKFGIYLGLKIQKVSNL